MTSPTLPPEAEALVQEALKELEKWREHSVYARVCVLRELARRLREPSRAEDLLRSSSEALHMAYLNVPNWEDAAERRLQEVAEYFGVMG